MDHVVVRSLEHLRGDAGTPSLGFAVETRDRPGPAYKEGSSPDDPVWVQLEGGLFVAKARILLGWVGEYSSVDEVRSRTTGPLHDLDAFWAGRPRYGYAAVARLQRESWLDDPFWAGPRSYGYEWVLLENDKKRASWLDPKPPPRGGEGLRDRFERWLDER
ncbi:MAG TPA: hypothetical protein VID47_11445 [Actinomycetota bacterium]|jgi:hypothetical protein